MKLFDYTSDNIEEPRYLKGSIKKPKICCYCEIRLDEKNYSRDHIVPKSKGGKRCKPCCKTCNFEKKDMTIREYISYLQGLEQTELVVLKIRNAHRFKAI